MVRFTIRAEIETGEDEPVNARSGSVLAAEVQGSPTDNFLPEIVCGADRLYSQHRCKVENSEEGQPLFG